MKIANLFVITLWLIVSCLSTNKAMHTRATASQYLRLASLQRFAQERISSSNQFVNSELQIPIDFDELIHIFNYTKLHNQQIDSIKLSPQKIDALNTYADKLIQDKRIQSYVQERIKRNEYGVGHGSEGTDGSGSFASELTGQLIGSIIGLSTTGSKGSSSRNKPSLVYGTPVYQSYGKDSFNIWDFKRAILNTLIQAIKAISGGVLALKGHLIKGSGLLVSTKGRLISSTGDAISDLGKNLASSAIVQPPSHGGYIYDTPQINSQNEYYDGPPPISDGYHSSSFSAPSNTIYAYAYYPPYVHYHYQSSKPMG